MNADNFDGPMSYWKWDLIRNLNIAIAELKNEDSSLADDLRKTRLGEVLFLRAFAYFQMVKRYGGVPLITEVQDISLPPEDLRVLRNKEAEIYDFIAAELDIARPLLASNTLESGRATEWAALALKSRAMLYAGSIGKFGDVQLDGLVGIPNPDKYWQMSLDASKEIIDMGGFSLRQPSGTSEEAIIENLRNIFIDELNGEIIFAEQFGGVGGRYHDKEYFWHPRTSDNLTWGGNGYPYLETLEWFEYKDGTAGILDGSPFNTLPGKKLDRVSDLGINPDGITQPLGAIFGNKDPRLYAYVNFQEQPYGADAAVYYHKSSIDKDGNEVTSGVLSNGVPAKAQYKQNNKRGIAIAIKGFSQIADLANARFVGSVDFPVFRLAEIYLNYAEAALALSQNTDEGLMYLNQVRGRAGMPDKQILDWTTVKSERTVELVFEDHRFWDLRRWRDAENALREVANGGTATFTALSLIYYEETGEYDMWVEDKNAFPDPRPTYRSFSPEHYYLPIGTARTQSNPVLLENPGYNN
jgi:hypothetical protein